MNKQLGCSGISRVAIYWDFQNSRATTEEQIQSVRTFADAQGFVVTAKAYAHWGKENEKIHDLLCDVLECIDIPSSKDHKNRADQQLIKNCNQQVRNKPHIKTVILISGDGDFTNLVKDLQKHGKKVIVISQCEKNTNLKLKEAADEFYTFSQIEQWFSSIPLAA
jgi:uncharacterized LabA/DUF88 family protein